MSLTCNIALSVPLFLEVRLPLGKLGIFYGSSRPNILHNFHPKVSKRVESHQGLSENFTLGTSLKQMFPNNPFRIFTVCTIVRELAERGSVDVAVGVRDRRSQVTDVRIQVTHHLLTDPV